MSEATQHHCSFCGKRNDEVLVLIAGLNDLSFICDGCVRLSQDIVFDRRVLRAAADIVGRTALTARMERVGKTVDD